MHHRRKLGKLRQARRRAFNVWWKTILDDDTRRWPKCLRKLRHANQALGFKDYI